MKKFLLPLFLLTTIACQQQKQGTIILQVEKLIQRNLPAHQNDFIIKSIPDTAGMDVFELESSNNKIIIRGSSVPAAAKGLNYYLKHYCNCHISQSGKQMHLPGVLPRIKEKIRVVSPAKYRYYLNYCTYNYEMAFWDWQKWEKELDWMALNGVNMALTINGMEAVWQNTLEEFEFTDKEIFEFIPGPAYQAWWLMGNLEGWGGPVSQKWIDRQVNLQKKILNRMRELQIQPLFHGFYGMVPHKLKDKYPDANIIKGGDWCSFDRPDFLDPTDPLFDKMAQVYYEELEKLYGKTVFYGGDPFHEGGNTEGINISEGAQAIQQAMLKAVPNAKWVLMGWIDNPSDELLAGVDKNNIIVLDLFNDGIMNEQKQPAWKVTEGFRNSPWIYCIVGNFGGRNGLYGRFDYVTNNLRQARESAFNDKLLGIGLMPEANRLLPVKFDYLLGLAWGDLPDTDQWIKDYAIYRYGKDVPEAKEAWQIMLEEIYNIPEIMYHDEPQPVYCARPALEINQAAPWGSTKTFYSQQKITKACKMLINCADALKNADTYLYDLVDLTRQCMYEPAKTIHQNMVTAYTNKNIENFNKYSEQFLELITDLDKLLQTRHDFLLGRWISEAREVAPTEREKDLFEKNARMLITYWGQDHMPNTLIDYAFREWSGLLNSYYKKRWELYINKLNKELNNEATEDIDFLEWEMNWTEQTGTFPVSPEGDEIEMAKYMMEKYTTTKKNTTSEELQK